MRVSVVIWCCLFTPFVDTGIASAQAQSGARDWVEREMPPLEVLEQAVETDPQDFESLVALGILRLKQDKPAKAAEALESAVAANPDSAPAHLFLGLAYNDQTIAFPILPRDPSPDGNAPKLKEMIPEDQRQVLLRLADREFEAALRLDPTDAYAWTWWGNSLLQRSQNNPLLWPTQDPAPILAKFRTALQVEPSYRPASASLAGLLYAYGSVFQHLVAHPDGPEPPSWAPEDIATAAQNYMGEATEIYWSFVRERLADSVDLYQRLLRLLLYQDRYDEALDLCREHIDPSAWSWLPHHFKHTWDGMLQVLKDREGENDRFNASEAAYRDCVAWLDR